VTVLCRFISTALATLVATSLLPSIAQAGDEHGKPHGAEKDANSLERTPGNFPQRPVRILVPTSPGGLIDFTARKFAEVATGKAGVPFVVINKPGAGGVVSFEETLRSSADGYTLQAVTRSNVPKLVAAGREDLLSAMFWAAKLLDDPQCVIVNRNSRTPDWNSVLAQALEHPGRQLWLGPDIGGLDHVSAARIWAAAGMHARWIPYESGGQAIAALLGGMGATYTGNPSEVRGRPDLKIVAVCAAARLPEFPDAPTFAELGVEGLEEESMWRGFALHPDTPPEILAWYSNLFESVTGDPRWREEWEKEAITVLFESEEKFHALIDRETEAFREFLQEEGILPDAGHVVPTVNPQMVRILLVAGLAAYLAWTLILGRRETRFWRWSATSWVVLVGFGLFIFLVWSAGRLPGGNALDPLGPGGIPLLWCMVLLPCLCGMALREWKSWTASASTAHVIYSDALAISFAGILLVAVILFQLAGYYFISLVLLPASLWILGWRGYRTTLLLTMAWLAFVYFVFQRMLHVDLPMGPLAFFGG
jgi:putative tricarboxylic transport membrane protein